MTTLPATEYTQPMNVRYILETAPERIRSLKEAHSKAVTALEHAKHRLKVETAKATIKHSGAKNQAILMANVVQEKSVDDAEVSLITAKGNAELAGIEAEKAENEFVAARKLAEMDMQEVRTFGTTKESRITS